MNIIKIGSIAGIFLIFVFFGIAAFRAFRIQPIVEVGLDSKGQIQFAKGKSCPDSLSADFENYQFDIHHKINDLDKYRTKEDRRAVVEELERFLCNRELSVGIHEIGGKAFSAKLSELYDNDAFIESSVSMKHAEVEWIAESGFCIRSITLELNGS